VLPDQRARRAHEQLAQYTLFCQRLVDGSDSIVHGGLALSASPLRWPAFRTAVRVDDATPAADAVATARQWFADRGGSHVLYARDGHDADLTEAALAAGYIEFGTAPEMACEAPCRLPDLPDGVSVALASTADEVHAYARVAGEAFTDMGFPAADVERFLDAPDVLLSDDVALAIGRVDGEIVAGAMTVKTGDGAYTSFVAAVAAARRKRLGEAVTALATNEAFARGADLVNLEASPFGEAIYRRMGYADVGTYRILVSLG
jgi:hypothetical protein